MAHSRWNLGTQWLIFAVRRPKPGSHVTYRFCLLLCFALAANLAAQDAPKPEAKPTIAELWATGCLWEVGDNVKTVPVARQALVDAGEPALKHALTRLDAKDTLETRCLSVVFAGWKAKPEIAPKALDGLIANIAHNDPVARRNVADLIDQFDDRRATDALLARAKVEDNEGVRMAQLAPLAKWKTPQALPLLVTASQTGLERLRARSATLLLHYVDSDDKTALDRMVGLLADSTYYVADAAGNAMKTASPAARGLCLVELTNELDRPIADQRKQFARQLVGVVATLAHKDTPAQLLRALAHSDAGLRGDAADALVTWKGGAGLLDSETDVQGKLHAALNTETDPFAKAALTRALQRLTESRKNG